MDAIEANKSVLCRRSDRKRRPPEPFQMESLEKGFITFQRDETRGMHQPNPLHAEAHPHEAKGNSIWRMLRKEHKWRYKRNCKGHGLADYVFLAPNYTESTAAEGVTKFENLRAIGKQAEKDGDDGQKILERAIKAWKDKQKDSVEVKEEPDNRQALPNAMGASAMDQEHKNTNEGEEHQAPTHGVQVVENWLRANAPDFDPTEIPKYAQDLVDEKFDCEQKILKYLEEDDLKEMDMKKGDRRYLMEMIGSIKNTRASG